MYYTSDDYFYNIKENKIFNNNKKDKDKEIDIEFVLISYYVAIDKIKE